ncbi:hypothetical protein DDZ13_14930 [Coraliomargarita sinensis]|uniref:Uncharacterized protein n=1 Tax=Coraliomargarita sinensis TaxID=2174842 RepID=A0A317ZDT0_9BACT|nr:hypothetical protein [Coraliomargarita sinensis]PXA02862.1 hypothetical protein DDZ13_14930 [Coraliomargarita sinensis]
MKKLPAALIIILTGTSSVYSNYVEVFFEGAIDTVTAGTKQIGEKIKGSFRYELDAEGEFPSPSMIYPLQTNFRAFPLSMTIDGNTLSYQYDTGAHLVDWSEENKEDFNLSSDGYLSDGNTNLRMECNFEGPDLFDSLWTLPNPPNFTNLSLARFSLSITTPSNLNSFEENYSGTIEHISAVVHPVRPEVQIVDISDDDITVLFYGKLQHSFNLEEWTDSPMFLQSSKHTYSFFEGAPKNFFVRATE